MPGTKSHEDISTKQRRIAELAVKHRGEGLNPLAHFIDLDWLHAAYRNTRKDGARGIDGQTAQQYAEQLEGNLRQLLDHAKSGTYRAPPVRRTWIPKGDGKMRPLGIPTFEDKVLQQAVKMVLEPIYEQDFLDCSYGFRPGRSAHDALQALWKGLMDLGGGWVLDVDIQSYFDTIDHAQLRDLLQQRIRDGVLIRLVGKWLNAGVMTEGRRVASDVGTPQGGVISPLLANIYLHEVLDVWFEQEVRPRLRGKAFLIRYADDFVMVFTERNDAIRVQEVLPKRFARFGLTLHPEKTRLVPFRRIPRPRVPDDMWEERKPGSFDFLGFTHHWERTRNGRPVVRQTTAKSRVTRSLKRIAEWCRRNRHQPIAVQHKALSQKLVGHCQYFGITGNSQALRRFRWEIYKVWWKWLARRSQRGMTLERFWRMTERYALPRAIAYHSVLRP
jgi:RNA-directed DNA polymerase